MIFDEFEYEPPQTYKDFRKSILRTIEDTEVESDEKYPGALFTVDRQGNEEIIHIDDIAEEEDDDVTLEEIIFERVPDIIRSNNSKYFAFVFSGEKAAKNEEREIVAVLSGDMFHTDMVMAEVNREYLYAELAPWEKENYMSYISLVVPMRHAISLQG